MNPSAELLFWAFNIIFLMWFFLWLLFRHPLQLLAMLVLLAQMIDSNHYQYGYYQAASKRLHQPSNHSTRMQKKLSRMTGAARPIRPLAIKAVAAVDLQA